MHIIDLICTILKQIPLWIPIGRIQISIGAILGDILRLAVDVAIIIIIVYLIKSHKKIKMKQEEILKNIKEKDD